MAVSRGNIFIYIMVSLLCSWQATKASNAAFDSASHKEYCETFSPIAPYSHLWTQNQRQKVFSAGTNLFGRIRDQILLPPHPLV